jgi:hypothetical protein
VEAHPCSAGTRKHPLSGCGDRGCEHRGEQIGPEESRLPGVDRETELANGLTLSPEDVPSRDHGEQQHADPQQLESAALEDLS